MSESIGSDDELGEALLGVMKDLREKDFKKDAINGGRKNKYITLDAINKELLPVLEKNKSHFIVHRDENQKFWGTFIYLPKMKEYSKSFGDISDESKNMSSAQAQGSSLTYGRRYVTCCFFNLLIDEDTDGEVEEQKNQRSASNQGKIVEKLVGAFQIKEIQLGGITQKGDKRICTIFLMDGREYKSFPSIKKNGIDLNDFELRLEALKNLIYFQPNVKIGIGIKVQDSCGIRNDDIKENLIKKAKEKKSELIFGQRESGVTSKFSPPIIENENIPF